MAICIGLPHGKYVNQLIENFIYDEFLLCFLYSYWYFYCVLNKVLISTWLCGKNVSWRSEAYQKNEVVPSETLESFFSNWIFFMIILILLFQFFSCFEFCFDGYLPRFHSNNLKCIKDIIPIKVCGKTYSAIQLLAGIIICSQLSHQLKSA